MNLGTLKFVFLLDFVVPLIFCQISCCPILQHLFKPYLHVVHVEPLKSFSKQPCTIYPYHFMYGCNYCSTTAMQCLLDEMIQLSGCFFFFRLFTDWRANSLSQAIQQSPLGPRQCDQEPSLFITSPPFIPEGNVIRNLVSSSPVLPRTQGHLYPKAM